MKNDHFKFFVKKCIDLFRAAKEDKEILKGRIVRGRASSCASGVEDLLGRVISRIIPENYRLIIDCPLSYRLSTGGVRTIYPDILVYKQLPNGRNILKGIIEVKIDLGYVQKGWLKEKRRDWQGLEKAGVATCNELVGKTRTVFKKGDFSANKRLERTFDSVKSVVFERLKDRPSFYKVKKGRATVKKVLERLGASDQVQQEFLGIIYGKKITFEVDQIVPVVVVVSSENDHGRLEEFLGEAFFLLEQHPNDYSIGDGVLLKDFIKAILDTTTNRKTWAAFENLLRAKFRK